MGVKLSTLYSSDRYEYFIRKVELPVSHDLSKRSDSLSDSVKFRESWAAPQPHQPPGCGLCKESCYDGQCSVFKNQLGVLFSEHVNQYWGFPSQKTCQEWRGEV